MLENLFIIFSGDPERGKRFQEAMREQGWQLHIEAEPEQAITRCIQYTPDLVIVDGFPESAQARSIFYELRAAEKGPFLVLHDSPGSLRFSRLGALSFIKMIKRDPEPADLISAIDRLIKSNRSSRPRRKARSIPLKSERSRCIPFASVDAGHSR